MKISFDLDDTLIPANKDEFPTEVRSFIQKLFGVELIRKDTISLLKKLKAQGHKIGVYTTSYRSKSKIWFQFYSYGFQLDFIINEKLNRKEISKAKVYATKYPPAFGIDVHIDDSEGVGIEGEKYQFNAIIIEKDDTNWCSKLENKISNFNYL
ncbi:HAD family hydrolase [Chondrinema litorale]|uniref:HAD family hydrolase n=1 Tax=Chondrinema litorale TaxID=2994555 RepID=UPI0025429D68|nr:HAD family hydrolase [Chondrinema litorale]UZR96076.1 HAD family hydrolase [Chondrinema litorale]